MHAEAATWHYIVAQILFMVIGVLLHLVRGIVNVYPDRLSDKPLMDMMISDGYTVFDWLFGTEYDENGFYRLESLKNLRIALMYSMVGGFAAMLLAPGFSIAMASAIDWSIASSWELIKYRFDNPRWM